MRSARPDDETKLLKRGHAIVQTDLFDDLAVFELQYGRSGEMHLPASCGRQRSDEKITERRTAMCATALPTADHIIALGDELGSAPEIELRNALRKSVMNALISA